MTRRIDISLVILLVLAAVRERLDRVAAGLPHRGTSRRAYLPLRDYRVAGNRILHARNPPRLDGWFGDSRRALFALSHCRESLEDRSCSGRVDRPGHGENVGEPY